jgi:hypothetical protein
MSRQGKRDVGKERFWRRALRQWRRSGLSVRVYCAEHGLTEALFYAWRRVIAKRDQERAGVQAKPVRRLESAKSDAPVFVPLRVIESRSATIEVVLPRGLVVRILRGFDAEALRQLLAVLDEERPC